MGLFSKKNESENTISKEILDAIHISTLDYVPGYKVVKAFGMVGGWSWSDNPINDCIDNLKEKALKIYPECNAVIGCQYGISPRDTSNIVGGEYVRIYSVYMGGTAVRIEPES